MKITHDVPGDRLTLEGNEKARMPPFVLGCLAIVVLFALSLPASFALQVFFEAGQNFASMDAGSLLGIGIGCLMLSFILLALFMPSRIRVPVRLDLNRSVGEARFADRRMLGGRPRETVVPLARLRGLNVSTVRGLPRWQTWSLAPTTAGRTLRLRFQVARDDAGSRVTMREVTFVAENVNLVEEVVDLAYRLGAASGLVFANVVRNDPRTTEVELRPTREPGFAPVPGLLGKADYANDVVAPAAHTAAAAEKVAPFAPETFPSDHRVLTWEPGRLVEFKKPLSVASFGCLPFVPLVLAGPAFFFLVPFNAEAPLVARLFASLLVGLFGLLIGGLALTAVLTARPRRVTFDWASGRAYARGLNPFDVPFAEISAVELREIHTISRSKNSTTHWYHCQILLQRRPTASSPSDGTPVVEALSTTRFREDGDPPYAAALPLATELARSLKVPRKLSEG